jgi:hypothetical protein
VLFADVLFGLTKLGCAQEGRRVQVEGWARGHCGIGAPLSPGGGAEPDVR